MGKKADKIFTEMCSLIKLNSKEKRLYKYILDYADGKKEEALTLGKMCKDLKTTPMTLLNKTQPSLREKGLLPVGM